MKVYADGVMAINFLVDFLLLLGTNRLMGFPTEGKRLAAASLLGALYSGVCLLPDFRFLGDTLWRIISLGLMGSIAFGWSRSAVQRCGVFLVLSLALGGFALLLGQGNAEALFVASLGLWLLCRLSFEVPPGSREYVPLEILNGGRSVKLTALRDTGNTLRDPISGEQVLVIGADAACTLTGLRPEQLAAPLETAASGGLRGLRLIPYRAVGQSGGMLLAMRFEDVRVDGKRRSALVAFAPENFGRKEAYQALTGGVF